MRKNERRGEKKLSANSKYSMLSDPVTQVNATTTVERLAALENSMIFLIAILGVKFSRPFF